ncbi:hypothetical protein B0T20DRAFT_450278 [Sordaria brevicollis]|uniref:Uncharacterized protein n=1 Tax=Sordaria brevicollis TaxID=83679 RepID=A0AAE0UH01_SORBR|nr:hypothetical protein B0T20DRAFT_450278 [Sordaria brevicollis]
MSSSAQAPLAPLAPVAKPQPRFVVGLSSDVWLAVCDYLTTRDLNSLARTCKPLYDDLNYEVYTRDARSDRPQALLWGAFTNQPRTIQLRGFERKTSYWTALHFAALFNHVEAVEFLLRNGANINAVCPRDGYFVLKGDNEPNLCTPLFTAIKTKSEEVAMFLLRNGASPLWFAPGTGQYKKETALYLAAHLGMWKLLEPIVRVGVDVNAGCHVDDVQAWATDTASQSIFLKLASGPRKPTEQVIAELTRLGGRANVRDLPGRNHMTHPLIRLIVGLKEGKVWKPNWPLASIMLRTGACDGTLEEVETVAAIQLALFPKNCPYTPNHTRHAMHLTYYNKKPCMYSVKGALVGSKCKCRVDSKHYPADDKVNGHLWQAELLKELVNFHVRHFGWKYLEGPLPFLCETVLTLLARHQRINTRALDTWLSLMPPGHKTRVTNVRKQTVLHIVLNMETFEEKLWYVGGLPKGYEINPYFDDDHDILTYLLKRCTSEELLAEDYQGMTPLTLLLGALYWDQDPEHEHYYADERVWATMCLKFVELMVSAIPAMSKEVFQKVFEELSWRRKELGCGPSVITVGMEGTGETKVPFSDYKPKDGKVQPAPAAPLDGTAMLNQQQLAMATQVTEENNVMAHANGGQPDALLGWPQVWEDGTSVWGGLMNNFQEEANNAQAQGVIH